MVEMARFVLRRMEDESGVSGVGLVAEGVRFTDGTAAMRWRTGTASTAVYASMADVEAIHGHGGKTVIQWVENDLDFVELEHLRQFKRDHFGITCRQGHHTRNADLLAHPDDENWRCAHCIARELPTE